jgi:DNA-binding XRE family transcriptional regulator
VLMVDAAPNTRMAKAEAQTPAIDAAPSPNDNLGIVVGHNIKRLRSRRNLSLEALAKLSGVSRAMLGQIETGRSVPTINVVWKIACAFDVPFSTLIASPNSESIRVFPANGARIQHARPVSV